ncbi:MAG: leucine-rich repeat domain-containing protein [Oscillospiraceae bacterium]|jgi:hypothetical protein|nr:leucine-rich repeat domain-containing protein [Oscillospiraceae bacterium]
MKNKLFKILAFLFILLAGFTCNTVCTHTYALPTFEITSSEAGNVMTVYNEEAGRLFGKFCVVREQIHEHECKHIAIVGRMNVSDFNSLLLLAMGCKSIDLSNVEIDIIPYKAFFVKFEPRERALEKLVLPSKLKRIDGMAFANRFFMKIDNLPSSLEFIDNDAFLNCFELDFIVPEKIKIGKRAFYGCPNVHVSPCSIMQNDEQFVPDAEVGVQPQNHPGDGCLLL